jgi:transcriptional regulator with XRE-family HTH domain
MQQPVSEASRMFGERVRARRVELACSQEEIALLAGMNVSNYGKIERGQGNPEFHTIVRLASVLNTDAGNLVTGIRGDALPEHRRVYSAQDFLRERAKRGNAKS